MVEIDCTNAYTKSKALGVSFHHYSQNIYCSQLLH
jgi:hypothetical protein